MHIEIYVLHLYKIRTMAKKMLSLRVSAEADYLIKEMAKLEETSQSNIFNEAIKNLAKKKKVSLYGNETYYISDPGGGRILTKEECL